MSESDSDEWATEDLPDLPIPSNEKETQTGATQACDTSDKGWANALPQVDDTSYKEKRVETGEPMFLLDVTKFSDGKIHSKFDANAVNDVVKMKQLRSQVEQSYDAYIKNTSLIADGTVIPCGSSVWRPALERMRRERPGHYFAPVFPPGKR